MVCRAGFEPAGPCFWNRDVYRFHHLHIGRGSPWPAAAWAGEKNKARCFAGGSGFMRESNPPQIT